MVFTTVMFNDHSAHREGRRLWVAERWTLYHNYYYLNPERKSRDFKNYKKSVKPGWPLIRVVVIIIIIIIIIDPPVQSRRHGK